MKEDYLAIYLIVSNNWEISSYILRNDATLNILPIWIHFIQPSIFFRRLQAFDVQA